MISWLRRLWRREPVIVPDSTDHDATIKRADRLLRMVKAYADADEIRLARRR